MIQKVLTAILIVSGHGLIACETRHDPVLSIDPTFVPYVELFEAKSSELGRPVKVTDLIIKFEHLPNPRERGACEIMGGSTPKILISISKWDKLDEVARRQLLFHEMGHCVLGRDHAREVVEIEEEYAPVPASLMNPYAIDSYTYSYYEENYNRELFTRKFK